jgi:hypothetical protein
VGLHVVSLKNQFCISKGQINTKNKIPFSMESLFRSRSLKGNEIELSPIVPSFGVGSLTFRISMLSIRAQSLGVRRERIWQTLLVR